MRSPDILNAANAELLESLYRQYRSNPNSVDGAWVEVFSGLDGDGSPPLGVPAHALVRGEANGTNGANGHGNGHGHGHGHGASTAASTHAPASPDHQTPVSGVYALIQAYRDLGHLEADINPLRDSVQQHPLLNLWEFGFSEADLDKHVGRGNFLGATDGTLRDLIRKLRMTYCGKMGVEYMHITDKEQRLWLQVRMEQFFNRPPLNREERIKTLTLLTEAAGFEQFLHTKFQGKKRFSLEGADALIPMLDTVITEGSSLGVEEIVFGMAHRGRLNVLANTMHKPLEMMFAEVKDAEIPKEDDGDGDVKYHLGYSHDRHMADGRKVHLSLSFNPSHLELVNPVVEGMVRAKQNHYGDNDRSKVVPVLIHGDAAFTGQGIVMETLTLCRLVGYKTGGTVHVVIDNQVGFTAEARETRFTPYPTDIMKMAQAPIFHVNADDPEAVVHAAKLAVGFRQRFKTDVMVHLLGYRRYGHNEADEPRFTQPLMYQKIDNHKTVREIYDRRLRDDGLISEPESAKISAEVEGKLSAALESVNAHKPKKIASALGGVWKGLSRAPANLAEWNAETGVSGETLRSIMRTVSAIPESFNVDDKKIRKNVYEKRLRSVIDGKGIDWGTGEVLAIGSLLLEGTPVRLVGQDSERGTFSHRQAVLHDIKTGETYTPLANLGAGKFTVLNTMLSELAVMGFEYGFSSADPWTLVLWEAQFGDFVNGAQAMIDQYLVAAESKWQRMNSLVLLLPHGYEGQGPEHSNARPERFLQLCAENNIQVCWPTTPAQHFHLLRRQMRRNFRKPLVVMTPKSLLRAGSGAVSELEEFTKGGFQLILDDANARPEKVKRLIFCSGKVYYTLAAAREAKALDHVALIRVEQLYPFPTDEVRAAAARYPNATECFWVQEEPRNMGGWRFVRNRLTEALPHMPPTYRGRKNAASPATGSFRQHENEEQTLIADSLSLNPTVNGAVVTAATAATAPAAATAAAVESDAPPAHKVKPDPLAAAKARP